MDIRDRRSYRTSRRHAFLRRQRALGPPISVLTQPGVDQYTSDAARCHINRSASHHHIHGRLGAARQLKDVAVDVLINSAGIAGASGQTTGNVDYDSWAHVLEVNTMGPLRVLECFIEHIARSERRLVVTITSGMGSLADNKSGGSIAYRSSKAAVNMMMRSAAIDLAPRRINCVLVNPGWVRTDMGGPKAPLSPRESVTAMRRIIETFGPKHSGKFYNYDGREYPW